MPSLPSSRGGAFHVFFFSLNSTLATVKRPGFLRTTGLLHFSFNNQESLVADSLFLIAYNGIRGNFFSKSNKHRALSIINHSKKKKVKLY